MRRAPRFFAVLLLAAGALSAATLFPSANQSNWTVTQGGSTIGKLKMTTDGTKVRVDWTPSSGTASSFVAADGKIWTKGSGGDTDFNGYKDPVGRSVVPVLLLPSLTAKSAKVSTSGSKVTSYNFEGVTAAYTYDAKGPQKIEISSGTKKYTVTRDSLTAGTGSMASFYEVKPKASKIAGLKGMAGSLLGPSDSSASASAGVRGMDDKTAMEAGINLASVETLIAKDAKAIDADLKKFQKEGKVGGAQ
jgi:hypothetical protein